MEYAQGLYSHEYEMRRLHINVKYVDTKSNVCRSRVDPVDLVETLTSLQK
jgi:hypothetical protein